LVDGAKEATARCRTGEDGYGFRDTGPTPQERTMLDADEARRRYVEMLTEKVRQDRYPSVTHMDRIEAALTPETAGAYLEMLMEKIASEKYPSPTMLGRIENVAGQLPRRPRRARQPSEDDDE
jgi:hypothetical protein